MAFADGYKKGLDRQGGELPNVPAQALKAADFVTYAKDVKGANCFNCEYEKEGVCQNPKIRGQRVNQHNCCALWDAPGTLRTWKRNA